MAEPMQDPAVEADAPAEDPVVAAIEATADAEAVDDAPPTVDDAAPDAAAVDDAADNSEPAATEPVAQMPAADAEQDWETTATPVGLDDNSPEVVALAKNVMKDVPVEDGGDNTDLHVGGAFGYPKKTKASAAEAEAKEPEPTFKPELISSAKIRDHAKSHGYGKIPVAVKKPKTPEEPPFKPDLAVGKITDQKRKAAAGSQYGKVTAVKKPIKVEMPAFKPQMVDKGLAKQLREKSVPRIYEEQSKYKAVGKKAREETQARRADDVSRYTLAGDRPQTAPETRTAPAMVFDYSPGSPLDPINTRKALPVPEVKHSKHGAKLKAKAASHYGSSNYTPTRGARPTMKEEPKWAGTGRNVDVPTIDAVEAVKPSARTKRAVSNYSKDTYTPKKGTRPVTPKTDPGGFATRVHPDQSPLNNSPGDLEAPKPSSKFSRVSSSGYGVKSPASSVPNKVESYKHRSATNQIRTNDYRGEAAKEHNSAKSNAENENPAFSDSSTGLINDLIDKAASMDKKAAPISGATALGDKGNGAVGGATAADEDTMLTML